MFLLFSFSNRFVVVHFDELPASELIVILEKRCHLPNTYAKKMVDVMHRLQVCFIVLLDVFITILCRCYAALKVCSVAVNRT